jgi:hypothetical protein
LKIFTGRLPYSHIKFDTAVILSVMRGGRPVSQTCPEISTEVWSILERCWDIDAEKRPSMHALTFLFDVLCSARPRSLSVFEANKIVSIADRTGKAKTRAGDRPQQAGRILHTPDSDSNVPAEETGSIGSRHEPSSFML